MDARTLLLDVYTGELFKSDLLKLISVLITLVCSVMVLYAVYIGYLFATAVDEGKRRAAKTRLIKVLASILIVIALVSIIKTIDVRFSTVEVSRPGDEVGGFATADFTYNSNAPASVGLSSSALSLTHGQPIEIKLSPNSVKYKGSNSSSPSGVTFTEFNFVAEFVRISMAFKKEGNNTFKGTLPEKSFTVEYWSYNGNVNCTLGYAEFTYTDSNGQTQNGSVRILLTIKIDTDPNFITFKKREGNIPTDLH